MEDDIGKTTHLCTECILLSTESTPVIAAETAAHDAKWVGTRFWKRGRIPAVGAMPASLALAITAQRGSQTLCPPTWLRWPLN